MLILLHESHLLEKRRIGRNPLPKIGPKHRPDYRLPFSPQAMVGKLPGLQQSSGLSVLAKGR
jgi:hypothetical protein